MSIEERDPTVRDLKEVLTLFWLDVMEDASGDPQDRIKSSELLAKYILSEGKANVRRKIGSSRPSTTEILRLADQIEEENNSEQESSKDA